MPELAPGFGQQTDPLLPKLAPGFGQTAALPSPYQAPTPSARLSQGKLQPTDLESYMAGNQSGWELFGKWAGQVGSEAVLGTLEAVSYFTDFEQMWDKLKGDEQEYTNWFAEAMKKGKEAVSQDYLKIYQTADAREGFAPGDATWWASQSPQAIGSTLSLLIPAAGVAGAVGKLGMAVGMGINTTRAVAGISAALTSRYAESTMEANNVFQRVYKEKMAMPGMTDQQARADAGVAASQVWNTNWLFVLQDMAQYGSLLKGAKSLAKGAKGMSWGEVAMQAPSEALEEAGQYVVSEEARNAAMTDSDYFGDRFGQRLYDYVHDPEFKSSVLLGGLSGLVFAGSQKIADTVSDKTGKIGEVLGQFGDVVKGKFQDIVKSGLERARAAYRGDTGTINAIDNKDFTKNVFTKLAEGKLPQYQKELEELSNTPDLDELGRETFKNQAEDVKFIMDEEARLKSNPKIPEASYASILSTTLDHRQTNRLANKLESDLQKMKQELVETKEILPELNPIKETQIAMEGYRRLASKQPQFAHKVAALQKAFESQITALEETNPNARKSLVTTKDEQLFEKSYQLVTSKEKMLTLKDDLAKLKTPEGLKEAGDKEVMRKGKNDISAFLNNPNLTIEEVRAKLKETTNQALQGPLLNKLQELVAAQQLTNQEDVKTIVEDQIPEVSIPEPQPFEVGPPEDMFPSVDDLQPIGPDALPEEVQPPQVDFAGGLSQEQASKWGLTPKETQEYIDKVDIETKTPKPPSQDQKSEDEKALLAARERTSVSAWLKEVESDGSRTIYTNNITGETATADKIFATDRHGNLLANTPAVEVGMEVELRLENDYPWVLTPGFKGNNVDNYVINVYLPGNSKPIKQLPSADNPRVKKTPSEQKLNRQLRDLVYASPNGVVKTTISDKNIGSIRTSPSLNSLEVLETDYVRNPEGVWDMGYLPHNPPIGYVDFNGRIDAPNIGSMQGMTKEIADEVRSAQVAVDMSTKAGSNKVKGKAVTFRRAPNGTLRYIPLQYRELNQIETTWLLDNMGTLLIEQNYSKLDEVIFIPRHPSGVYSTKGKNNKAKLPDILNPELFSRRRFHIVTTGKNTSDLLVPLRNKAGNPIWIIIDSKQFVNFFTGQNFAFKILNESGTKSPLQTNYAKTGEIIAAFKKLVGAQYKNVNANNLNTEIQYTDPVTGVVYPAFYDYLVATNTLQTDLPGTKTIGVGPDSSYSFNEAAVYLDPKPSKVTVEVSPDEIITKINEPGSLPPDISKEKIKDKSDDELLDEYYGGKLKKVEGAYADFESKNLSAEAIQWFKDTYGDDFIEIMKNVRSFIASNGVEAFGQYYNGLVTIAENSPPGTAYHEALHMFLDPKNGLVTEKEREKILDEASKVYGIKRSYDPINRNKQPVSLEDETAMQDAFDGIKADLADPTKVFAEEDGLLFDPGEDIKIETDPISGLDMEASFLEPTDTQEKINKYFIDYEEYFVSRYQPSTKYTGPRKKGELKSMLDNLERNLRQSYASSVARRDVELDVMPSQGDMVNVTTRFLKNIRKNPTHSTNLDKPFKFKDANPKENEMMESFYNFIISELTDFSKQTGKAMPKSYPNEKLAEKLAFWLQAKYGVQTYDAPITEAPYGLHNILKNSERVEDPNEFLDDRRTAPYRESNAKGGEVFVSDGLHFPNIASGHNKPLGNSGVYSNTLGWFIESEVEGDLFLYEFQSDILPEVNSGDFKFTTDIVADNETEVQVKVTLGGHMNHTISISKNNINEDEIYKRVKELVDNYIQVTASGIASKKVQAERHLRGDSATAKQEITPDTINYLIERASEPSPDILREYISFKGKLKMISRISDKYMNKPEFLQRLVNGIGTSARPLIQYLQFYAPATDEARIEDVYVFNGNRYNRHVVNQFIHYLGTRAPRYAKGKAIPAIFTATNANLRGYYQAQNERKGDLIKKARTIQKKLMANKTKSRVEKNSPGLIGDYYEGRRNIIQSYYQNEFEQDAGRYAEDIIYDLKNKIQDVVDRAIPNRRPAQKISKAHNEIQKDYEHWYKIMFDKFIRIALIRAKAAGRKQVYMPTYQSIKEIENSGRTGRIYATPQENLAEKTFEKAMERGEFKYNEDTYRVVPNLQNEIEYQKINGTSYLTTEISRDEYYDACTAMSEQNTVGPFYAAISKIKGVKILGLKTPNWSTQPLLNVDISEFNETEIERFKLPSTDRYELTGDAQLEEELATDFERYKLSNGHVKPPVAAAKGFFARLWQMIKRVLGFKAPIERLFKNVDTPISEDQKRVILARRDLSDGEPKFKLLKGFQRAVIQQEAVQAFASEVMRVAHEVSRAKDKSVLDVLSDKQQINTMLSAVRGEFENDANRIKNMPKGERTPFEHLRYISYLGMGLALPEGGDERFVGSYEDPYNEAGFPIDGFKTKVLKELAKYGFRISIKDKTEYDVPESDAVDHEAEVRELKEEDEGERIYDVDHTQLNPSKSLSNRVRLFLSTIPEPTGSKTVFGTPKYIDFRRVDGNLGMKLVNSLNPLTRLQEIAENDLLMKSVYDALMSEKNKGNMVLYKEFLAKYTRDGYYKDSVVLEAKEVFVPFEERAPGSSKTTKTEYAVKVMNTDQLSADKTLMNRWREEAVRTQVIETDGSVIERKAGELTKEFAMFKAKYYENLRKKNNLPYSEVKEKFLYFTKQLGATVPEQVFNEIELSKEKSTILHGMFFGERAHTIEDVLVNYQEGKDPYEGSTILTDLAVMSIPYIDNPSGGAYLNEKGDQEFPNNTPAYITELFNKAKKYGKDLVSFFRQDAFYTRNAVLDAIAAHPDRIELKFTSTLRDQDDAAMSFEDRTEIESILMRLSMYHNNGADDAKIFAGTASDKTKQPTVTLPKHKEGRAKDFATTIFKWTALQEAVRINRLKDYMGVRELGGSTSTVLPNDIKNLQNATGFLYIPALNQVDGAAEQLHSGEMSLARFKSVNPEIEKTIEDFLEREYGYFLDYLWENDIIYKDEKGQPIDKRLPKGLVQGSLDAFLREFFYNDITWRMELSKVMQGDLAFYSSGDDYFKRQYQLVTPGYKGYTDTEQFVTRGVYTKQYKKMSEEEYNNLKSLTDKETADKYQEANNGKGINKTDAQSLATIEGYRKLADALGQWTPQHERLYTISWAKGITARDGIQNLVNAGVITEEEAKKLRKVAAKTLIEPFKPFQFNDTAVKLADGKVMIVKEQFKDSITPILPELAQSHKGYADLLAHMKTNKLDIMSAADTVKVGLYGEVTDFTVPMEEWQKREIKLTDFRFPQFIPDTKKEEVSGTQFHKLALGNIKDDTTYTVGGKPMLGKEVKATFNTLWAEKVANASSSLKKRLGVGDNMELSDNPRTRKDQIFKLKTVLEQELSSRDLNENYLDVLELVRSSQGADFTLPLSFPAFGAKFQSIMTNLWKKAILRQKSPGYSAVNLADFGVGYTDELKFMQVDPTTGETYTEIGLPISFLKNIGLVYGKHIWPNGTIKWESSELTENQKKALQFILYRIPTSNKSSMINVRVARITPPQLNNIVLIPGELTIQQGLDFDVDKSQLIRRTLDKDGNVDDSVDTKLFDLYWGILTNKAHIKEVAIPLSSPTLETMVEEYRNLGLIDSGTGTSIFSLVADVKAEIRNKDGKREIGVASRFNTGHAVLQTIPDQVGVTAIIEIDVEGSKDYKFDQLGRMFDAAGTLISENHAESQQAALDAAKNPLLSYLNVVTGTMAAFHTMINFGVPLPVVTDFFMQPVIKEWTKYYKQENQRENKATDRLFISHPTIKSQLADLSSGRIKMSLTSAGLKAALKNPAGTSATHDARVLMEFQKIMRLASQLTKINNVLSIDTFQDATGVEALEAMLQQKNDATNPNAPIFVDARVFDPATTPPNGKRLAAFYKFGIDDALGFIAQFYPSANTPYRLARSYYAEALGQTGITSKEIIKKLNQFLDFFQLQGDSTLGRALNFNHPLYNKDPQLDKSTYTNRWSFFAPEKSMWKYINSVVAKYPALSKNELIKALESQKDRLEGVQLIGVRNTDNNTNKSEITNAWWEMLNAQTPEIKVLAHDLIRYAVFTSGFTYGIKSFIELVPVQYWVQSGLGNIWKGLVETSTIDSEAATVSFIRHNFRTVERFPELYGRWTKKGFQSDAIRHDTIKVEEDTKHIKEFRLHERDIEGLPRFFRMKDVERNILRLYESSPTDPLHFREVQPLGEKYYWEAAAARNRSFHPRNKQEEFGSPDPWNRTNKTQSYPLIGTVSGLTPNPFVDVYLPAKENHPEIVLNLLKKNETDPVALEMINKMLSNVDKIYSTVFKEPTGIDNAAGVFNIKQTGESVTTEIKIHPDMAGTDSEVRHIILHELIHAFSVGVIGSPKGEEQVSFVRNLKRLRDDVIKSRLKQDPNQSAPYGLVTPYEFIAELGSSRDFRSFVRNEGFWARTLRLFRKLLGMKDSVDQILDQYYTLLDNISTEDLTNLTPGKYKFEQEKKAKEQKKGSKRIDILTEMISSLKARRKTLRAKGKKVEAKGLKLEIDTLEELMKNKRNEATVRYIIYVDGEMMKLRNQYFALSKDPATVNPDALYAIREQLDSFDRLDAFSDQIRLNPDSFVPVGGDATKLIKQLDDLRSAVHQLTNDVRRLSIKRFATLIKKQTSDERQTLEAIEDDLTVKSRDVSFWDRWTDVGSEMNDVAVMAAHKILKASDADAYRQIQEDLYTEQTRTETANVAIKIKRPDGGFTWETEPITYKKVSFLKALNEFEAWTGKKDTLADKFKHVINTETLTQNDSGVHFISPFSKRGKEILSIPVGSKDYPLRQFYETFVLAYLKSQENIPLYSRRPGLRLPTIGRSFMEAVINEKGAGKFAALKERFIDAIRLRYDELDFKAVDQNNKPQDYIPIRFVAKQDGKDGRLSTKEVSLDVASSIPLFIHEMYTRTAMEKVQSDLELGKLVLGEREVMKTKRIKAKGAIPWLTSERTGIVLGSGKFETTPGTQSQSYAAFNTLLRRFMYGQFKKSEGDFEFNEKRYSLSKMVDSFLGLTGFKIMFGSLAIPLTNAIVGEANILKEVVGGNIINKSDYVAGKKLFKSAMGSIADLGRREKTTKFGRIFTYFNPLDTLRPVSHLGVDTNYMRTVFDQIVSSGGRIVDFYLGSTVLGAVFNRFKAQDSLGKDVSLYDALEVSQDGKVTLNKGYTYKGKSTLESKDIDEVRDYVLRAYELMNAVVSKQDKPAYTEYILGRLVGFMRTWLVPGINTRWKTKFYDERLKQENEGHYVSALIAFNNVFGRQGWVKNAVDSLKILATWSVTDPQLLLLPNELTLSPEQQEELINMRRANMRKTIFELYTVVALSLLIGLGWDEDDDESYVRYMAARVRREIMTFADPTTLWDVLKSPTVALNTIDGIRKVMNSGIESGWAGITGDDQPYYERGPYQGEHKLWADTKRHFGFGFEKQFEDLDTKTRVIIKGFR